LNYGECGAKASAEGAFYKRGATVSLGAWAHATSRSTHSMPAAWAAATASHSVANVSRSRKRCERVRWPPR